VSRDATAGAAPDTVRVFTDAWKVATPVALAVLIAVLLLYWETVAFTVDFWSRRRAYGHGLLLLPISLFIVWQSRATLARLPPLPQPWGLPLVLGASLLWALAHFIDVQLVMQLALLAVIATVLWTLLGNRVARVLAFPVGYLLLGIPVWSLLTPVLQDNTASASTDVLRAIGVPVHLEAFYISIPSGQFVVERVCAGLRYLMATMSIAALFAYLNLRRVRLGVLFFFSCVTFSIILNWLRVVTIIWVGHASSMQHWLVRDHLSFGWGMFAVGLIPMFAFGIWLQRFDRAPRAAMPPESSGTRAGRTPRFIAWGLVALVLAGIGPGAVLLYASRSVSPPLAHLQAPEAVAPWTRIADDDSDWGPAFVGTDAQVRADYADDGARVSLYIAYYAVQRDGSEVVSELNRLYDEERWKRRARSEQRATLGDGTLIQVREVELVAGSGAGRLVWYWYRLGDQRTTSVLKAKLLQLWQTLSGAPSAALVAVSAPMAESRTATRAALEAFLAAMGAASERAIEHAAVH
jgi:exosortase A